MRFLTLVAFIVIGLMASSYTMLNTEPNEINTIALDPGHGGHDPGTVGSRTLEKDINLSVVYEVGALFKQHFPEKRIVYTRYFSDEFVALKERTLIANKHRAKLFVSVHCNASPISPDVSGYEIFISGKSSSFEDRAVAIRENAVIKREPNYKSSYYAGIDPNSPEWNIIQANRRYKTHSKSLKAADAVYEALGKYMGRHGRGVKENGFLVLVKTDMPAILVELGFLTNKEEEDFLADTEGQTRAATALFSGIRQYIEDVER